MTIDSIQDSTRYIVKKGKHRGAVLPGNRMEMSRAVFIETGAEIEGGVWAGTLEVTGSDVSISESVYCEKEITVKAGKTGNRKKPAIEFKSTVTTSDSIVVTSQGGRTRFRSDIYAGRVNLKNCVVYGNVFADSAIIEDCVILGGVFCRDLLRVRSSIISAFESNITHLGKQVGVLVPFGISREALSIDQPIRVLTFQSLFDDQIEFGSSYLDQDDVYSMNIVGESGDSRTVQCLSLAERIFDTSKLIEVLSSNANTIREIVLEENIVGVDSGEISATAASMESVMFDLKDAEPTDDLLTHSTKLQDLIARWQTN
ncbi:hypothetical protein JYU04_04000 [Dehalococcoides mccartyi]|nr:hypothetical protein [Dehalococcoides mccartyi]